MAGDLHLPLRYGMQDSAQGQVLNSVLAWGAASRRRNPGYGRFLQPTSVIPLCSHLHYAIKTSSLEQTIQNPQINIIMEIIWS